jgi:hypothetical protein
MVGVRVRVRVRSRARSQTAWEKTKGRCPASAQNLTSRVWSPGKYDNVTVGSSERRAAYEQSRQRSGYDGAATLNKPQAQVEGREQARLTFGKVCAGGLADTRSEEADRLAA